MKHFDFIVIGGGIAGLLTAYELKEFNTLLIDENGILSGASKAAGAFLFPKIGFDTSYTRFINNAILESFSFYEKLGIDTHKKGVVLLPRDERDLEKFKKYEKEIKLPFEKKCGGFYFKDGGVINPDEVKEKIKIDYEIQKVKTIYKEGNYWVVNGYKSKNVILATGYKKLLDISYINIRPIWGERIDVEWRMEKVAKFQVPSSKLRMENEESSQVSSPKFQVENGECGIEEVFYHKNCSVGKVGDIIKIGATHKRNCLECKENEIEAKELIKKANEIVEIKNYEIKKILGGFRAASVDYFPVLGKIIDIEKTLKLHPKVVKGEMPKEIKYIDGLYIINGMGGRGFSNAVVCAKLLKQHIIENKDLGILDNKRLFIKWARRIK